MPPRIRDQLRRWKLKRSAVLGPPARIDKESLYDVLEELLGERVAKVSHANVSGYKEGNAHVVWAIGDSGRSASLVAKDTDLRPDAYPAVKGFPGPVGLPESRIYQTAGAELSRNLPVLHRRLELVKDAHLQYFLENLNVDHRIGYSSKDLLRCTEALLKVEREIASWIESDAEVPLINYGGDFPQQFIDYARTAIERYVGETADSTAAKLLDSWSEVARLYLQGTPDSVQDFVHGDYRVGNIFHLRSNPSEIRLVDWEFAGRGWIHNDLASLLKPADRDTTREAIEIVANSRRHWSFSEHWRVYQRCRLERGLLDAALVANQRLALSKNPRISETHTNRVLSAVRDLNLKAPAGG